MKRTMKSYPRSLALLVAMGLAANVTMPVNLSLGASTDLSQATTPQGSAPDFGAYDPYGAFSNDKTVKIEHLFLPWEDVDLASLPAADSYAAARARTILITIEPWTWSQQWRVTPTGLRDGILSGKYDPNLDAICRIAGGMKTPVTIRFAHEMEDKRGRFSWANWNPADYIAAYKHVVDRCRTLAPHAAFMWSPKGDDGLAAYYPGDSYVDVIGLSVFGLQKFDRDKYGRDRTFSELLKPGYDRVVQFNKPIVVAELGYSGSKDYVAAWDAEVRQPLPAFPKLTAVVYFNDKEVYPWPDNYGLPDWRIRQNIIN